jgi:DNA-binding transcriptional MerR regulator
MSIHMSRFIKIGQTAELLGVSIQTLRRWEKLGELLPDRKTTGRTRYYDVDKLLGLKNIDNDVTIAYAIAF